MAIFALTIRANFRFQSLQNLIFLTSTIRGRGIVLSVTAGGDLLVVLDVVSAPYIVPHCIWCPVVSADDKLVLLLGRTASPLQPAMPRLLSLFGRPLSIHGMGLAVSFQNFRTTFRSSGKSSLRSFSSCRRTVAKFSGLTWVFALGKPRALDLRV